MFRLLLRYRPKRKVDILFTYSLIVIIIFSSIAGAFIVPAFALPPALIKARTIGELIVTLFAGAGTAITSPTVVPAIYSNYGGVDYSLESLVNDGIIYDPEGELTKEEIIENLGSIDIVAPRAFDLDTNGFRQLINSNWQAMKDCGVDAVLRVNDIANADSVYGAIDNLGQLFLDVANYGYLGTENAIAVLVNPGTTVKVGFEDIKEAVMDYYGGYINKGIPYNTGSGSAIVPASWLNFKSVGALKGSAGGGSDYYQRCYYSTSDNVKCGLCVDSSGQLNMFTLKLPNVTDGYFSGQWQGGRWNANGKPDMNSSTGLNVPNILLLDASWPTVTSANTYQYDNSFTKTGYTAQQLHDIAIGIQNGTINDLSNIANPISPDFINQVQGNINNPISVLPAIDNSKNISIIPQSEYEPFMQEVKQNTDDGLPEENAILLQDLINDNSTENEGTDEPVVNPDQPIQPTIAPKPTNTPEQSDDVLQSLSTPGLEQIFPFCLPFDLDYLFRKFMAEPKTPKIDIPFKIQRFGIDETITLDFAMFDNVASLLRKLMVIAYIVFLIFETRNIIGA